MKIVASKSALLDTLKVVSAAVSKKPIIPASAAILIEAKTETDSLGKEEYFLDMTATSGDLTLRRGFTSFGALEDPNLQIMQDGKALIDATYLTAFIKNVDGDVVHIDTVDGTLHAIYGKDVKYRINGMRPEDFPVIDFDSMPRELIIPADAMVAMLKKVSISMANVGCSRPVLAGVNIAQADGKLIMTGCDSYRLSKVTVDEESISKLSIAPDMPSVTIPASAVDAIETVLRPADVFEIYTDGKRVKVLDSNGATLVTSLLDGAYPSVDRLVPTEFAINAEFNRAELLAAVDRCTLMREDKVAIASLDLSDSRVRITSRSPEVGTSEQVLKPISYQGEPLKIAFNATYVVQALKALSGDNVMLRITSAMKPSVLEGSEGANNIQLILPVRTYDTAW